jgi:hypothetical protein
LFDASRRSCACLAVAVKHTSTSFGVDLDLLAAPDDPGDGFLEVVVEVIRLPVLDIVRELEFTIKLQVNVVQEAQIQLLANHVRGAFLKVHGAALVGLVESPQQVR